MDEDDNFGEDGDHDNAGDGEVWSKQYIYPPTHPPSGGPHPPTNAQLSATPNLSPLALSISIVSQSCYLALC